jgi:hypothetical protein
MHTSAIRWFKTLSRAGKIGVVAASVLGLSVVSAATGNNQQTSTTPQKNTATVQKADVVTHKTITTTESIPFDTTNVDDATLAKGTVKTTTEGVDGVRTHTFDVAYKNGVEVSRSQVSDMVTTQPVAKVIATGTYIPPVQPSCPNGTYVNSAGNTVCSPYQSTSAPSGATAQCVDGTYSFSQSRSGTCSHHGGVASWL